MKNPIILVVLIICFSCFQSYSQEQVSANKLKSDFWKHVQFIMFLGYQYQLDNEWIVNKLQSQNNNNNMDVAEKEKLMAWLLYIQNINTKQEQLVFILRNNNKIL